MWGRGLEKKKTGGVGVVKNMTGGGVNFSEVILVLFPINIHI